MKKLVLSTGLLAASSVMAHEGVHSHPHGIESIYVLTGLFIVGCIVAGIKLRKHIKIK